ncbi:MAG: hypothetical protein QM753_10095 [Thermomicrobiales bacterium]
MRISGPDIYFENDPAPDALLRASSAAFGVPGETIVVTRMLSDIALRALRGDDANVVWQRETDDQPGDFPAHYLLEIPATIRDLDTALRRLAITLAVPFVVTARDLDAGDVVLYDDDGSRKAFTIDLRADEDYAIHLPVATATERRAGAR